jgi:dTDP-3-amino-2,3,6-trideoxy-4-keto-D-glucose/dTDP-3-amino-3,4,6-trideoxy-alpha-D-glucose/dTDP-2,6-dideoxy-D-kanosamine transaminase
VPVPLIVPAAAPTRLDPVERAAVTEAIERVVMDGPWIGGASVEQFESDFATYLGGTEVVGVANGTDALALAFAALELPHGSGVLIAANEGGYAATAARQVGLLPVVMDVDPITLAPSVGNADAAITPGVSAIVITHLHGDAVDLAELDAWRKAHNLRLIEDCAQATGLRVTGTHVGFTGDAAAFSFYPTKNLGAMGDGGALVFAERAHTDRARSLAQYGWGERFRIERPGGRNSRLDSLQAAILSARLPFLDGRNATRRGISTRYREALSDAGRIFGDVDTTVAHHAVAIIEHPDELAALLADRGIQIARHYPYLLTEMPGLELGSSTATPQAAKLRDQSLSLPCFPEMTGAEVDHVVFTLEEWVSAGS